MPAWKLIGLMIGWVLASVAIAIVMSIVLTESLVLVNLVDWGSPEYAWAINGIALVMFVTLICVPIVFRKRFVEHRVQSPDK
jgi:hypothetical protein